MGKKITLQILQKIKQDFGDTRFSVVDPFGEEVTVSVAELVGLLSPSCESIQCVEIKHNCVSDTFYIVRLDRDSPMYLHSNGSWNFSTRREGKWCGLYDSIGEAEAVCITSGYQYRIDKKAFESESKRNTTT